MKRLARLLFIAALLLTSPSADADGAAEIKVLSFNVWVEGARPEADVMRISGADIIAVQEGESSTATMARLLDYNWSILSRSQRGTTNGIISRFPIVEQYDNGVQLDLGPLGEAYVFGVHLTPCPYQPYELHSQAARLGCGTPINTGSAEQDAQVAVQRARAVHGNQIRTVLEEIEATVPPGKPVFLLGDFNEPSHLDWTVQAGPDGAGLHTHVVPWPTSIAVTEAGFKDSYREIHPDETLTPGFTWTTLRNNPEVHDRIDFVYYQGDGVRPIDSILIGDLGSAGGIASDLPLAGYPSDHRAVLTTFLVPEPGISSTLTALLLVLSATRRASLPLSSAGGRRPHARLP